MQEIKLFLLERQDTPHPDDYVSCVVAANSEKTAREEANAASGGEGFIWTDSQLVEATELAPDVNEGISGIIQWSKESQ